MLWIRRRVDLRLAAVAVSVLFLGGCGERLAPPIPAAHGDEESPHRGGTLRLASFADIRTLDPAVSSDAVAVGATEQLFAGLVDYDEHGHVVPDLALRYEVVEDGLVYRFFLREGVRFHDGEEVTADDVRRSVERALAPTTPNPSSSFYETIDGYETYTKGQSEHLSGITVDGRYVISIRLRERDARFLAVLALPSLRPVCRSAGDRYVDTWAPCGAGPFELKPGGWDRGRSLTIVRHPGYFRPGLPYLDAITWTYSMNIVTERFKLEDGDLDATRELSQADAQRFQADPRWKPFGEYEPDRVTFGESMNTELPPFNNIEVRRAVAAAIDREQYQLLRPTSVDPATQLLPPAVPGYDAQFKGQRHDNTAALEHMHNAGYPYEPVTGTGGYPTPIVYTAYRQGYSEFSAQILQQQLAKIGLRLELRIVTFPTFLALTYRRKASVMSAQGWQQDYPDPSDFFDPLFSSAAINDEESTNSAFYRNPRLDELLDRGRRELDTQVRYAIYREASRLVCDDAPWAFAYNYRYFIVHQPYVRNYHPHAVWPEYLLRTWIDRSREPLSRGPSSWGKLAGLGKRAIHGQARFPF